MHNSRMAWGRMCTLYQPDGVPPEPFTSFPQLAASLGLHSTAQRIVSQIYKHGQIVQRHDSAGIIYAIFFNTPRQSHVYVGKTKLSLSDRFRSHLDSALQQFRFRRRHSRHRAEQQQRQQAGSKLYSAMQHRSLADLVIVPLQQLSPQECEPANWDGASMAAECLWIMWLNSLGDSGFTTMRPGGRDRSLSQIQANPLRLRPPPLAPHLWDRFHAIGFDPVGPFPQATTIRYAYRDYDRRLRALHAILLTRGPAGAHAHVRDLRLRNLSRMLIVGRLHAVPHLRGSGADSAIRYLERQPEVLQILSTELQRRKDAFVPPARRRASVKMRFSPFWSSSLLDSVPLSRLLSAPELLALLPPPITGAVSFMLAPKYTKPLIRQWCNIRGVFDGSTMSLDELRAFSQVHPCPCSRVPEAFRCMPGAQGHVVTTDGAVLSSLCPGFAELAQLWDCGAKFRPHEILRNSEGHMGSVREHLVRALDSLCQRIARHFSVGANVIMPFHAAFLGRVDQALAEIPHDLRLAPEAAPTLSVPARQAMKHVVLQHYIVTVVDKSATSFALVCKRHAASLVLHDLSPATGPSAFTLLPDQPAHLLQDMRTQLSTLGYNSGELRLPVYAGMPKVHKLATGLLKWRFLSYSSDIFSTPLAKALT